MALMQAVRRNGKRFIRSASQKSAADCGHGSLGGLGRSVMLQVG